jgi:hypothetical protein
MTSYKIEDFLNNLDHGQTVRLIAYAASRLTIAELADAVTEDMTASELGQLAAIIVQHIAELDAPDDEVAA